MVHTSETTSSLSWIYHFSTIMFTILEVIRIIQQRLLGFPELHWQLDRPFPKYRQSCFAWLPCHSWQMSCGIEGKQESCSWLPSILFVSCFKADSKKEGNFYRSDVNTSKRHDSLQEIRNLWIPETKGKVTSNPHFGIIFVNERFHIVH